MNISHEEILDVWIISKELSVSSKIIIIMVGSAENSFKYILSLTDLVYYLDMFYTTMEIDEKREQQLILFLQKLPFITLINNKLNIKVHPYNRWWELESQYLEKVCEVHSARYCRDIGDCGRTILKSCTSQIIKIIYKRQPRNVDKN